MLKTQQSFASGKDNVFTEEINKTDLGPNDDKRINQLIE